VERIPDNKITANIDTWGTISGLTIESSDPDFILTTIEKLKKAMPPTDPQPRNPKIKTEKSNYLIQHPFPSTLWISDKQSFSRNGSIAMMENGENNG